MSHVVIAGVGMTHFGKHPGIGVRNLAVAAVDEALADAGMAAASVAKLFFGNAVAGIITQQEMIRGQVAFRHHELGRVPIINVENACASGGSALHLAYEAVAGGSAEIAVAIGVEQLNHRDRSRSFNALRGSTDIEEIGESTPGAVAANSILMDYYAGVAQSYLDRYEATPADFARVAVKNRGHASHNPLAHLRRPQTLDEVLQSRVVAPPLTLPMCSPMTDGAAALVLCSEGMARKLNGTAVRILSSRVAAGAGSHASAVVDATLDVYEAAGVGPQDLHVIELHDAAAPAELIQYAEIGLCEEGRGHHLIRSGETALGGRIPVNTSGGLLSRGHPLGATGCAQLVELCTQLRGRAGARQVPNATLAMAVNGGGWLDGGYAVAVATILQKVD
jgi:acetyl-CoA acyltransferase